MQSEKEQRQITLEQQASVIIRGRLHKLRRQRKKYARKLNNKYIPSEMWFQKLLIAAGIEKGPLRKSHIQTFKWGSNYVESNYILDIAFRKFRIGIEIDGGIHQNTKTRDKLRDEFLTYRGWVIYRVNYGDITRANEIIQILLKIKEVARTKTHFTYWNNQNHCQECLTGPNLVEFCLKLDLNLVNKNKDLQTFKEQCDIQNLRTEAFKKEIELKKKRLIFYTPKVKKEKKIQVLQENIKSPSPKELNKVIKKKPGEIAFKKDRKFKSLVAQNLLPVNQRGNSHILLRIMKQERKRKRKEKQIEKQLKKKAKLPISDLR